MAGPVTHIILALQIFNYLPEKNLAEFIRGTSFTDINKLETIEREKTHNHFATWVSIKEEQNSFKAGNDFHDLVDRIREHYFTNHGLYQYLPPSKYLSQVMKIYEDSIMYEKCHYWHEIINYLETLSDDALSWNIPSGMIKKWYNIIMVYCSEQPCKELFSLYKNYSENELGEIYHLYDIISNHDYYRQLIVQFYQEFPKLLEQQIPSYMP